MVKSYQGVRQVVENTIAPQQITVEDFMTRRLITFKPEQSIDEVTDILIKNNISGGPVVDEDGRLIGIISEGDCLNEAVRGKYNNMPNLIGKVKEYMVQDVVTIQYDMNILEAAKMFLSMKLRRFPVIQEGKLVGQISQRDVLKATLQLKEATWKYNKKNHW